MKKEEHVLLNHGSGGVMTQRLVEDLFLSRLENPALARMDDSALVGIQAGKLAVSTDSFVVDPIFFPGGNIGKLAVCGTVNDVLVAGARPVALTAGFILEEGLPLADLERIVDAMAQTAKDVGVPVVAGDTKVVPRGKADGCFINTAGVGEVLPGLELSAASAQPGDLVLVSGTVGDHGTAIMGVRAGIDLGSPIVSDCAPLTPLLTPLWEQPAGFHVMRDPTRGGLATVLCEIAAASGVTIELHESDVPVAPPVHAACELLGLDPMYLACEGRVVVVAAPDAATRALEVFKRLPQGAGAAVVGEVKAGEARVVGHTPIGGRRLVSMLSGDPLPRIC